MIASLSLIRLRSPYDTLEEVIGLRGTPGHGSLREWGVAYRELPLAPGGSIDWDALATAIRPGTHWSWLAGSRQRASAC